MTTKRFTLDGSGQKAYIGDTVLYGDQLYLIEDIEYLSWSQEQYLTLVLPPSAKNKKKKLEYISPSQIYSVKTKGTRVI